MKTIDFESLFEHSPQPILVMDKDLRVIDANAAYLRATGLTRTAVVGQLVLDSFAENTSPMVGDLKRVLERAIAGGIPETTGLLQVDSPVQFMVQHPADDSTSNPDPNASTVERLQTAATRKDEFLGLLAHELRNPLSSINAAAEILSMGIPDPARLQKMTDVIKRQINLLAGLIDNLSDVSHLAKGLVTDEMRVIDLKQIISEAIEQHNGLLHSRNHLLNLDVVSEEVKIYGDHKRILQALGNLLANAARYTPSGGNIKLQLFATDSEAVINIVDDGPGIPPDLLPGIFEIFANRNASRENSQHGLGIGLAVVKSIIEVHGGSVKAVSNPDIRGSRSEIRLPRK